MGQVHFTNEENEVQSGQLSPGPCRRGSQRHSKRQLRGKGSRQGQGWVTCPGSREEALIQERLSAEDAGLARERQGMGREEGPARQEEGPPLRPQQQACVWGAE